MPDREVKTVRDLIFYQYAKIVARSAMGAGAKQNHYGFFRRRLPGDGKFYDKVPALAEKKNTPRG